jgi:DNA-binding CsgD family transcriptional regulator
VFNVRSNSTPRWVGASADRVTGAVGDAPRLKRVFARSPVPMTLVDHERRHVDVNTPARLAFRRCLRDLRDMRIDDLTPDWLTQTLENAWECLLDTGSHAGPYEVTSPDGGLLQVSYFAVANVLPGQHVIAFAPAAWPDSELVEEDEACDDDLPALLTPRELEVLELAAGGCNGPVIAGELVVSAATVRTHFEHIYEKLGVSDRAAAVAKAMRTGLIA